MKFQDFHPDQIIEAGPYVLTEAELLSFAQAWDPQWFSHRCHRRRRWPSRGLIASGWRRPAGIAMRLAVQAALARFGILCLARAGLRQMDEPCAGGRCAAPEGHRAKRAPPPANPIWAFCAGRSGGLVQPARRASAGFRSHQLVQAARVMRLALYSTSLFFIQP